MPDADHPWDSPYCFEIVPELHGRIQAQLEEQGIHTEIVQGGGGRDDMHEYLETSDGTIIDPTWQQHLPPEVKAANPNLPRVLIVPRDQLEQVLTSHGVPNVQQVLWGVPEDPDAGWEAPSAEPQDLPGQAPGPLAPGADEETRAIREANYLAVLRNPAFDDKNSDEIMQEVQSRVEAGIDPRGQEVILPPGVIKAGNFPTNLLRDIDTHLLENGTDLMADPDITPAIRDTVRALRTYPTLSSATDLGVALGMTQQGATERIRILTRHLTTRYKDQLPPPPTPEPLEIPIRYRPTERTALVRMLDRKLQERGEADPALPARQTNLASYISDPDLRTLLKLRREGQPDAVIMRAFGEKYSNAIAHMDARLLEMARRNIPPHLLPRDLPQPSERQEQQGPTSFNRSFAALVENSGMTYAEIASRMGVHPETVSRVFGGMRVPQNVNFVHKLARALRVSPELKQQLLDEYYEAKAGW